MEEAPPAHDAGMQEGVGVGEEALANRAGFPGVLRSVERHVNHHRSANDVAARDAAPEAAVERVAAVITQGEITILRNVVRESYVLVRRKLPRGSGHGGAGRVLLDEHAAVDPDGAV